MACPPRINFRILAIPKEGSTADEYEDAAAVRSAAWPVRAAVADGATESAFARLWAETIAEGMLDLSARRQDLTGAVPNWQDAWADESAVRADAQPWYATMKAEEGAFAAFLGLELMSDGRWRAIGVGDSVLFHLRDGGLHRAWPYTDPDAFSNRPALLPSRDTRQSDWASEVRAAEGRWHPDDTYLLATDAVAEWLLRTEPTMAVGWDEEAFRTAARTARSADRLRNDDSTLLVLDLSSENAGADGDATQSG